MIFNGFANDIDWHIEYIEPDPGVYVKSPQYISYIYDRTMNVNIKVVGKMIGGLHAEILETTGGPTMPTIRSTTRNPAMCVLQRMLRASFR